MTIDEILDMVLAELARAESIHPHWPGDDLVHAAGIVSEESGELIRAALRHRYAEGGTVADVRTEAIHTATTAIRLLKNLEEEDEMNTPPYILMNEKDGHVIVNGDGTESPWDGPVNHLKYRASKRKRGSVLDEAKNVINGERQDVYGSPEDSFALIAEYWSTYLGREVTAQDVALMMTLFKIARQSYQHKRDNLVDAAGYLGILGDMCEDGQD